MPANHGGVWRHAEFNYLRKFGAATAIGAFEVQTRDRIFCDGFEM